MLHTIFNEQLKVEFNDAVGEVSAIDFAGVATLKPPAHGAWPKTWPVMFPICGKLKDNKYLHNGKTYELPGHGFFRSLQWEVVVAADSKSLRATATNCASFTAVYPFSFSLVLSLSVHGSEFSYTLRIQNLGAETMYFNSGHHGAFLVDPKKYHVLLEKPASFVKHMAAGGTGKGLEHVAAVDGTVLDLDSDCSYQSVNSGVHKAILHSGKGYVAHLRFQQFDVLTFWARPQSDWLCIEPWNGTQDIANEAPRELSQKPLIKSLLPDTIHEDVFKISYEREE